MLLLKGIIDTSMDLAAMEESSINLAVNNNNNSAFQLHSQKHSAEMEKIELLDNDALVISGIHPEKNCKFALTLVFNSNLMMRSNNMSKSKREQYSFELNRGSQLVTQTSSVLEGLVRHGKTISTSSMLET